MSHLEHNTNTEIILSGDRELAPAGAGALAQAGQIANHHARRGSFSDYLSRKSQNTVRAHGASLIRFAEFLNDAGAEAGLQLGAALAAFARGVAEYPDGPELEPGAWQGVTWGLVEAFRDWMISQGDAVASINMRLSVIKTYAKLAMRAGVLDDRECALIRTVSGYSPKEEKRINERRPVTRRGAKKAAHVSITPEQAKRLKHHPDTPQGRRDALLMCLLLDHGLRVGEVAGLKVGNFDLKAGELRFYRPKVDKEQTHKLSADTLRAARVWFDPGNAPIMAEAPALRGSQKGGKLTEAGMSERAITARVRALGKAIGLEGLSAHDCRHFWATFWARKVDVLRLQEAGGWSSLAMPRRYVEEAAIANEGMA